MAVVVFRIDASFRHDDDLMAQFEIPSSKPHRDFAYLAEGIGVGLVAMGPGFRAFQRGESGQRRGRSAR